MTFLICILIILLILGIRIAYALGISALLYVVFYTDMSVMVIVQRITIGADSLIMVALPFFLLAGELMNASGITDRLIRFALALIGRVRGGLSFVVVVTNMIMAAVSGAAIASGAAIGSVMVPAMTKKGFSPGFSGAVNAVAATIGPVIPPSIGFIIYASVSNTSIGKLFIAGTIPGIILGILVLLMCYFISAHRNYPAGEARKWKEMKISFKESFWALLMPIIIIGGIMSGIVTATEAGVTAAVYGIIVGVFIYRTLKWNDLIRVFASSAKQSARIMLIIACASAFGWIISREVDPQQIVHFFDSITSNKWTFLILITLVILILGTVMEGGSIMVILTPLLLPILHNFDIDLIYFGVVFQLAIMVGLLTPPVGILLFVISGATGVSVKSILREISPFYLVLITVLLLCIFFPNISLWLGNIGSIADN